jgi:hypothetical protein
MELGILSKAYESSGDPGAINHHDDDKGNCSYGAYQFYAGSGTVQNFIAWLQKSDNYYSYIGNKFNGLQANSDDFNAMWQAVAAEYPKQFLDAQYQYAKLMYYDVAIAQLAKIGFITQSVTMQNVIWSCAIQYSPYKVPKLFNDAAQWIGYDDCTKFADERLLIAAIYFIRCTDDWNKNYRKMCYRMALECHDAIDMLKIESSF